MPSISGAEPYVVGRASPLHCEVNVAFWPVGPFQKLLHWRAMLKLPGKVTKHSRLLVVVLNWLTTPQCNAWAEKDPRTIQVQVFCRLMTSERWFADSWMDPITPMFWNKMSWINWVLICRRIVDINRSTHRWLVDLFDGLDIWNEQAWAYSIWMMILSLFPIPGPMQKDLLVKLLGNPFLWVCNLDVEIIREINDEHFCLNTVTRPSVFSVIEYFVAVWIGIKSPEPSLDRLIAKNLKRQMIFLQKPNFVL